MWWEAGPQKQALCSEPSKETPMKITPVQSEYREISEAKVTQDA